MYDHVFLVSCILDTARYRQRECYSKLYFPENLSFGLITFAMGSHQSKPSSFAPHQSFHLFLFCFLIYSIPDLFHKFTLYSNLLPQINHLTHLTYRYQAIILVLYSFTDTHHLELEKHFKLFLTSNLWSEICKNIQYP